jgi:phospholipid/cholesterol/gamma-HCH transport system ATP-binding protein
MVEDEPIIRFCGVKKAFGDNEVLSGVDLEIPRGKTTVILGPSGTGKSVLIKLLVGLIEPDGGAIFIDGVDITAAGVHEMFAFRKRVGMLFQDGALFDSMTVAENIGFPLRRHSDLSEEKIAAAVTMRLEQVGLPGTENLLPSALSGGMRKRVSLARAIILEPEILLFDEPNSGLDPITSDEIDALIARMKAELGITFIVISHDIVGAFAIADKIAMLYKGQLVAEGSPDELLASRTPIVRQFLSRNIDLPEIEGNEP